MRRAEKAKVADPDFCFNIIDEYDYISMPDQINFALLKTLCIGENTSINKVLLEENFILLSVFMNRCNSSLNIPGCGCNQ